MSAKWYATAFVRAGDRYPDLFARHNALSWYKPSEDVYINAVYDLANTYLGDLSDDILGEVYERQLARVDRKQLGQYYTPRDIIKVIWDLIDIDRMADAAEDEERPIRILDIATGSGGFLVAASSRLRGRLPTSPRRRRYSRREGMASRRHRWPYRMRNPAIFGLSGRS